LIKVWSDRKSALARHMSSDRTHDKCWFCSRPCLATAVRTRGHLSSR
jgi:hypothetical protein